MHRRVADSPWLPARTADSRDGVSEGGRRERAAARGFFCKAAHGGFPARPLVYEHAERRRLPLAVTTRPPSRVSRFVSGEKSKPNTRSLSCSL